MRVDTMTYPEALALTRSRAVDYLELTKPRVTLLVLVTVAAGTLLASRGTLNLAALVHTLLGTALVAGGAAALNQFLERHTDALMRRTENRPLPAGRLQPPEVLVFGSLLGLAGVVYLALALRHPLASLVAGLTFVSYVFLYTPLKRKTALNTLVGAVPGALPPVIGWTAVSGTLDPGVLVLFLILFLWQIPHFLAIAWIYREDYARAGLQMLPVVDGDGGMTGRQMVSYCLALIPASLAPVGLGLAGWWYLGAAMVLGFGFLACVVGFNHQHSLSRARRVVQASLIYLPALMAMLLVDGKGWM
ncbi:MAG: protoheme IX farnesyltransferase [Planctomycetes bacterium]|nr:protoheme IX farnesyltransferase [Planctomycetota bacterium]